MANGYDKFFKEAQRASGLTSKKSVRGSAPRPKEEAKAKFQLKPESRAGRAVTPEDRLRAELAERMRRKQKQVLKKKKKFPLYPVLCATAALITCAVGYLNADLVDDALSGVLSKVEVGFLGHADAAEPQKPKGAERAPAQAKEEKNAGSGQKAPANPAETKAAEATPEIPNTKGWTPEELSFFSKLNERKKELDLREAELAKLEEELQKRKAELDEKLKTLEATRAEISKTLKSRVATDQEKVDKLIQFYSNMKPQQAAKVIETLNEDLAVEVLDKMKKKNAAEIMNMMDARKARKLSELMTGYERSPASASASSESAENGAEKKE